METLKRLEESLHLSQEVFDSYFSGDDDKICAEVTDLCKKAYNEADCDAEYRIHRLLYKIYSLHSTLPSSGHETPENSYVLTKVRNLIENAFIKYLDRQIPNDFFELISTNSENFWRDVKEQIRNHKADNHPLYEQFLRREASVDDIKYYLLQESAIDASTDDYVALTQIGTKNEIKMEMAKNFWDEMGNGDIDLVHSHLFMKALTSLKLDEMNIFDIFEPETFVCGNLQLMLALSRKYFYLSVGYFLAVEFMVPKRFGRVMLGWRRNNLDSGDEAYYKVHITTDVEHTRGWVENVVVPLLRKYPDSRQDILRGVYFRLFTSTRYLDALFHKMSNNKKIDQQEIMLKTTLNYQTTNVL